MKAELQDADGMIVSAYYTMCGEEEIRTLVGQHHITEIRYHAPVGEGDRHFVDVYYNGQLGYRYFNFTSVEFWKRDGGSNANVGME